MLSFNMKIGNKFNHNLCSRNFPIIILWNQSPRLELRERNKLCLLQVLLLVGRSTKEEWRAHRQHGRMESINGRRVQCELTRALLFIFTNPIELIGWTCCQSLSQQEKSLIEDRNQWGPIGAKLNWITFWTSHVNGICFRNIYISLSWLLWTKHNF